MENTTPLPEEQQATMKGYPTAPDADGWYYTSAAEEAGGIEIKKFPNDGFGYRINGVEQYPTAPGPDGFFYENEGLCSLKIETWEDKENEDKKMRVQLSRKRVAIVKELDGKDNKKVQQIAGVMNGKNFNQQQAQERTANAMIAVATTITDEKGEVVKFVMEDLETSMFKGKDVNRLATACNMLNF